MIITHISLKNWKTFQSVDVDLRERVFLVGSNASGKSNFLDALRFLRDLAKDGGGLQKAVRDRGGLSKIKCLYARRYPDVGIEVHLSENELSTSTWRYSIGIKQRKGGKNEPVLSYERVWKNGEQLINRPDSEDKKDNLRLTQTHLEQINANAKFREISKFLESISYLHLVPQLLRYPEAFTGPGIQEDPFGRNFLGRVIKTPEKTRRSRLKKIEDALKIAVPQLKQLTDIKDEMGIPHLEAVYEHWRPKKAKQREDQFSDGTLRLIGLLWSLLESDSLLLLEEPELSLNSGIIAKLPSLIYRSQKAKKRQVMLSTHSADLLSDEGIGGEELLLMRTAAEGTKVEVCSSIKEIRMLLDSGLTVADAALPFTRTGQIEELR